MHQCRKTQGLGVHGMISVGARVDDVWVEGVHLSSGLRVYRSQHANGLCSDAVVYDDMLKRLVRD